MEEANIITQSYLYRLSIDLDLVLLHISIDLFTLLSQLLLQASNQFSHLNDTTGKTGKTGDSDQNILKWHYAITLSLLFTRAGTTSLTVLSTKTPPTILIDKLQ